MNKIQYAVLYTSFLLIANVLSANETKFGELNNLKFGDMKKMALSNNVLVHQIPFFLTKMEKK